MNRLIASTFASLIAFIHAIVLIGLGGITLIYFSDNARKYDGMLAQFGMPKESFVILIIAIWIGYVLIMGVLSTLIAMNENMERLVEALNEIKNRP